MEIINGDTLSDTLPRDVERFLSEWEGPSDYITAHTSGSTGAPKEILLPKADILHSARATCERFGLTTTSRLVSPLSADYIAGKMMIARAIVADCTLIVESPSNRPLHADYGTIDLLPLVPSQVDNLILSGYPSPISHIIIGGATLSPMREEGLVANGYNAYVTYGMTETCSHVALRHLGSDAYQAMPGIRFDTTDEGALVILSDDYSWRRLTTRDAVELIDDRHFRYLGRLDNVINSGGVKLHPEEIELELAPYIPTPYYIVGVPDPKWGEALQLVVETSTTDNDAILAAIASLPPLHRPHSIRLIPSIPRTTSGKIIRVPID